MKQLQNNFTTPEQSKRLLELGCPLISADCCLTRFDRDEEFILRVFREDVTFNDVDVQNTTYCCPCWSIGRLIEIMILCDTNSQWNLITPSAGASLTDWCMEAIEVALTEGDIDFSKLED